MALAHLLHCLPGALEEKASVVFAHAHRALTPGGALFGATILGEPHLHTPLSRAALLAANRNGAMCNLADTQVGLERALGAVFDNVRLERRGAVALFSARA